MYHQALFLERELDIIKKAITDMFDGEKNIPQSVRDAMHLDAYGKGKPLTAKRIPTTALA